MLLGLVGTTGHTITLLFLGFGKMMGGNESGIILWLLIPLVLLSMILSWKWLLTGAVGLIVFGALSLVFTLAIPISSSDLSWFPGEGAVWLARFLVSLPLISGIFLSISRRRDQDQLERDYLDRTINISALPREEIVDRFKKRIKREKEEDLKNR